jgi:hypothetical protein
MERQIIARTRLFLCPFFFSLIDFSPSLKKGCRCNLAGRAEKFAVIAIED